jgi:hypothetical protein
MKITIFILMQLVFINCHEATDNGSTKKKPLVNEGASTLKLVELLSFNSVKNTSLFIVKDSVLFVIPDHAKTPQYYQTRNLFYDSANKKFHFKSSLGLKLYKENSNNLFKSNKTILAIKSIGNPMIKYAKLPDELKQEKALKGIIKSDTKIHLFNGQYFFIYRLSPRLLYSYNPITKKMTSFEMTQDFFEVTDFFLYDVDEDHQPEIFIFNIGNIPRADVVSYTIYSIRKKILPR